MKRAYRVLITGSPSYRNYEELKSKLNFLFTNRMPTTIVCDAKEGAGALGIRYAKEYGIPTDISPSKISSAYHHYEKQKLMVEKADKVIAFINGDLYDYDTVTLLSLAATKHITTEIIPAGGKLI